MWLERFSSKIKTFKIHRNRFYLRIRNNTKNDRFFLKKKIDFPSLKVLKRNSIITYGNCGYNSTEGK